MHYQALLVAYFCSTAAALPLSTKTTRQSIPGFGSGTGTGFPGLPSGGNTGAGGLGGLLGGLTGGSGIPSIPGLGSGGIPSLPSGLPGLGGGGAGAGGLGDLLGGLTGGAGTGLGSGGLPSLPSGLPGLGGGGAGAGGLGDLLGGLTGGSGTPSIPGLSGDSAAPAAGSEASPSPTDALADTSASPNTAAAAPAAEGAAGCKAVTVIFARGTTEPGTLGMVVGPGLNTAVAKALNNNGVVTGVAYAASAGGIATEIGTGGAGTQAMVKAVADALAACPDTQIVLSGYSQGAMLVHNAMNSLDAAQAGKVKAAVTFGDPFVGQAVKGVPAGAFKSFCASADPVCTAGAGASPSAGGTKSASASGHLGYGSDVTAAAEFIKGKVTV
ncbi:hypothetical protein KVR01_000946 [Diaporthe batatas]|uniref:uncharacterized protein n=1 Tax=Diaporthe batatas TaxID=748121 RepID=UPI001D0530EB|nr:uncharacterized protein KVR01_000946 [Diaporthe batatas]KAG8170201.1 hypothetical protein KVR01_000946 [Diaporthe batatas]